MRKILLLAACFAVPVVCATPPEHELKDASGKTIIRYAVEAPENVAAAGTTDPARQVGLILCFQEHDRPTGDEILPVREALKALGMIDGYVLLAGHPQERKFNAIDDEPIAKLISWAKKTYPINPRRVYMYGKGEGGQISGAFTMLHPDIVTAAISYSWGWWRMPSELKQPIDPLGSAPEFYMVLGLRDLSYHLTTVRDAYSRVSAKGYHVIYREFDDLGARTYHPPSNQDAIAWATRLRNKNIPPSPEEMNLLQRFSGHSVPAANAAGYYTDIALVGGVPAGAVIQKLLASENADVRTAAAATCSHGIFDESTMAALGQRVTDPSSKVRSAAIHALGINANWRSEAAQQALIDLATHPDKAANPNDRVDATDAINRALRFQVKGVRQDPPMFKALVTLLDDKDEELRVMAANTLALIRDADYRGDLARPEQKAPNGGWSTWLDQITTKAAGYSKDYEVCAARAQNSQEPVDLYCKGGASLKKDPAAAFTYTLQAAEKGYVPAQAAVGMMYANGKGVQQNYAEAAKWWTKAAEQGHILAATNASMVYRGVGGVPADQAAADKWAKFVAEHSATTVQ